MSHERTNSRQVLHTTSAQTTLDKSKKATNSLNLTLIMSRLTFGGSPFPSEWSVLSESICDLANAIVDNNDWDPASIMAPEATWLPPPQYDIDNKPLWIRCKLIFRVTRNPQGKFNVCIKYHWWHHQQCTITIDNICLLADHGLMTELLDDIKNGIDLNLIAYCSPERI